jgi:predicted flap endonuclease-1-like 5' DNA nuclease
VRATYRTVRALVGLLLLTLSVSWLLLRRRRTPAGPPGPGRRLTIVPPVPTLDPPRPAAPAVRAEAAARAEVAMQGPPAEPPSIPEPDENGITPPAADIPAPRAPDATENTAAGHSAAPNSAVVGPTGADDLRAIKGIGPATESALHDLGIRTFRQLAVLDGPAREELRVALKDTRQRMEREDWVGQATELHRAKYGEDPLRPV